MLVPPLGSPLAKRTSDSMRRSFASSLHLRGIDPLSSGDELSLSGARYSYAKPSRSFAKAAELRSTNADFSSIVSSCGSSPQVAPAQPPERDSGSSSSAMASQAAR